MTLSLPSGPVLDVGDPNVFTSADQPTTLMCEVSGTPAPTVTWTRGGKPLEDERILVLADHSLFIQDTCLEVGINLNEWAIIRVHRQPQIMLRAT